MKKKLMYRIYLTERDSIFTDMALDAALSNGSKYVSIEQLYESANFYCRKYPATGSCHTVNLIGNVLTIDKGVDNILIIEEVEILEIEQPTVTPQDARDILDSVYPTINRYGINNPDFDEALN